MSVKIDKLIESLYRDSDSIREICTQELDMQSEEYLDVQLELFKNKIQAVPEQFKRLHQEELAILNKIKTHTAEEIKILSKILSKKEKEFLSATMEEKWVLAKTISLLNDILKEITKVINNFEAKSSSVVIQHTPKHPPTTPEPQIRLPKLKGKVGANKNMDPVLIFPPVDDRLPPREPHLPEVPRDPRGRKKK